MAATVKSNWQTTVFGLIAAGAYAAKAFVDPVWHPVLDGIHATFFALTAVFAASITAVKEPAASAPVVVVNQPKVEK